MKSKLRNSLIIPAAVLSTMLAIPAFAQTGMPHSADNTTNPNAQNATNPDAQVPPQAPGTAVGGAQPAAPADQADSNNPSTGSSNSFTTAVKDTDITAKVMYGLHENDATSGADIHVTTNNGIVTLYGRVKKHHQAMEAVNVAKSTAGVREVVNQLAVAKDVNG
ncbi:MAG TPA: BON domain-containing protein [Candidatus Binataceae bacterium]|nr:BON domain-containing protein [Candidatus Binataceae bacterium]